MKMLPRTTSLGSARTLIGVVCVLYPLACISAEAETAISKVALSVRYGATSQPQPTGGTLYRAGLSSREKIAYIGEDGKPDRPVTCKGADKLEAQAESVLDQPLAPKQLECRSVLAFSFIRVLFGTAFPFDEPAAAGNPAIQIKLYVNYADAFTKQSKPQAAQVLGEAATMSAAFTLGDVNLDKYVFRDPKNDYKLRLSDAGIIALKSKQEALGLEKNGKLDGPTVDALSKSAKPLWTSEAISCVPAKLGAFNCSRMGHVAAKQQAVILPSVTF